MILTDSKIQLAIDSGQIELTPLDLETQLQPASLDVRLGQEFRIFDGDPRSPCNPTEAPIEMRTITKGLDSTFTIDRGEFVLGTTLETVTLDDSILGQLHGRSSWGRCGLAVHVTAGVIDPGFSGQITLELHNHGPQPLELPVGTRIGQLVFKHVTGVQQPYGSEALGSSYNNQRGAQPSRLHEP